MMPALLQPVHEAFAQHYSHSGSVAKAAVAAGLERVRGGQLLRRADVQKRIIELNETQFAHIGVTAETVKTELARIAFASVSDLYDKDGELIPLHELPDDVAATITQVDVEVIRAADGSIKTEVRKVKRADKGAALAILARHYKVVGDEDDGINLLANVLADRLNGAKARRLNPRDVEEAQIIKPRQVTDSSREPVEWRLDIPLEAVAPTPTQQEQSDEERLW